MQNIEWYLADLKSTGKNTSETVEKKLTDMFIRLVRIYPCLVAGYSQIHIGRILGCCRCAKSKTVKRYRETGYFKISLVEGAPVS